MSDVNLSDFPQYLANALGMPLFAGQILAGLIVMMLFLVPVLYLTKGKNPVLALVTAVVTLMFSTAIAWFPIWSLAIVALIIAVGVAMKWKDMI